MIISIDLDSWEVGYADGQFGRLSQCPANCASRQPVAEKEPRGQKSVEVLTRAALANIDATRPAHGRVPC
jgi:hypothetical protein